MASEKDEFETFLAKQSKIALLILQEILHTHPRLMSRKFKKHNYQKYTESNGLNLFSRLREIVEQGLGHLFIASSSSHFFSKKDLGQYLFNSITHQYNRQKQKY